MKRFILSLYSNVCYQYFLFGDRSNCIRDWTRTFEENNPVVGSVHWWLHGPLSIDANAILVAVGGRTFCCCSPVRCWVEGVLVSHYDNGIQTAQRRIDGGVVIVHACMCMCVLTLPVFVWVCCVYVCPLINTKTMHDTRWATHARRTHMTLARWICEVASVCVCVHLNIKWIHQMRNACVRLTEPCVRVCAFFFIFIMCLFNWCATRHTNSHMPLNTRAHVNCLSLSLAFRGERWWWRGADWYNKKHHDHTQHTLTLF